MRALLSPVVAFADLRQGGLSCGLSQPLFCHCAKLMLGTFHKNLRGPHQRTDEMFLGADALGKFGRTQDVRVDLAAQPVAHAGEKFL